MSEFYSCLYIPFLLNLLYPGYFFFPPSFHLMLKANRSFFTSALSYELQNHITKCCWKSPLSCSTDTLNSVSPKQNLLFFISPYSKPCVSPLLLEEARSMDIILQVISSFSPNLPQYSSRLINFSFSIPIAEYLIQQPFQPLSIFFFKELLYLFIYLFIFGCVGSSFLCEGFLVAASGGHSSSRCAGLSLSRPLVAEHRLQTRRLSSCGSRAQLLRGMWDLPRPGLEPVSPALAGRFLTTAPPGKPPLSILTSQILDAGK